MLTEPCLHPCGWLKNRFPLPLTYFSPGYINSENRKVTLSLPVAPRPPLPHGTAFLLREYSQTMASTAGWQRQPGQGGVGPGESPSPAAPPQLNKPPWSPEGLPTAVLAESPHILPGF